ncbi:methyltransferase domain-containing protein [Mycolicibacterium sp. P1-18]|uniref:class I SAM-dependent methyltransferase n=1 Tax=Mycolicibacterium sp. P1-18 TaxID=2024615 RepID=UPI0011F3830D|nr:class I SAM-dependent methyltransferase [Mycolicibacterium sp. P1-18]KAA0101931.1 methyltransferase domain-containing protein [Mycolicibacterium sp. P1-18]
MNACRACGHDDLRRVLDVGAVPAADYFPPAESPVDEDEGTHPLAMDLCAHCGLAQLTDDDTVTSEPRGVEPQALRDQARDAVDRVGRAGWLRGTTVREFGSPHGGTWLPLLDERGFAPTDAAADVVLDCFGIMHEPDQRAAFASRAAATAPGGVLLLQYHSLSAIVRQGQWNALRHGHFAYYSLPALTQLLAGAGMRVVTAWDFELYGGTVLVAAVHADDERAARPDPIVAATLAADAAVTDPEVVGALQASADGYVAALRSWLVAQRDSGTRVYGYGAASRAVAAFAMAGLNRTLIAGVADASTAKQGRRMPGTDVPIISPEELVAADPDVVLLTLPDLLAEVSRRFPRLAGRWRTDDHIATRSD